MSLHLIQLNSGKALVQAELSVQGLPPSISQVRRLLAEWLSVRYGAIATDNRGSFGKVSGGGDRLPGKQYTKDIGGNNCRLGHRDRRSFRNICCFSKKIAGTGRYSPLSSFT